MWWLLLALSAKDQWCNLPRTQRFGEWQTLYGKSANREAFEHSDAIVCSDPAHFRHSRLSARPPRRAILTPSPPRTSDHRHTGVPAPPAVEWSLVNTSFSHYVTIEDQGSCSSCWAFTTTTVVEAALSSSGKRQLSSQHLLDCARDLPGGYRNLGCDGGYLSPTMQWVTDNGLVKDATMPYTGSQAACAHPAHNALVGGMEVYPHINTSGSLVPLTEQRLKDMVAQGPTEVAMYAPDSLTLYQSSDVFTGAMCGSGRVNHAVVIVGYGTRSDGLRYWKVANSWGTEWNGDGYFLLERGVDACRVESTEAVRPTGVRAAKTGARWVLVDDDDAVRVRSEGHWWWGSTIVFIFVLLPLCLLGAWLATTPDPPRRVVHAGYFVPAEGELPPLTIKL